MMRGSTTVPLILGLASVLLAGCELFLPERGGLDQPCLAGNVCRDGLTCDTGLDGGTCVAEGDCQEPDADGDGFAADRCGGDDCDDGDPAINPDADENCTNGVDDDCDGDTDGEDQDCGVDCDGDGDGFGSPACGGGDCDDGDAAVHPGAREDAGADDTCSDGRDNDCDGHTDAQEERGCAPRICSDSNPGWCWVNPLPQGNDLNDVWVSPWGDIWAVGAGGTILRGRIDGQPHFWRVPCPSTDNLTAIWGAAPDAIWAVGFGGTILHYDGQSWQNEDSGTSRALFDVHGTGPDDVWVAGQGRDALHRQGGQWYRSSYDGPGGGDFVAVWATPVGAWFGAGSAAPQLVRYENGTWETAIDHTCSDVRSLWSPGPGELIGVGQDGAICQLANGSWTDESVTTDPPLALHAVAGGGPDDVWVVGGGFQHRLGFRVLVHREEDGIWNNPVVQSGQPPLLGLFAGPEAQAIAVGMAGRMLALDGNNWQPLGSALTTQDLHAVHGDENRMVAVGNSGSILVLDDGWSDASLADKTKALHTVWVVPGGGVWVGGSQGLVVDGDGGAWTDRSIAGDADWAVNGIWATEQRVYAAGQGGHIHVFEAMAWNAVAAAGEPVDWLDVLGWNDGGGDQEMVWLVGAAGWVRQRDYLAGQQADDFWLDATQPQGCAGQHLRGVWGPDQEHLWLVGSGPDSCRLQPGGWGHVSLPVPADAELFDVHGAGVGDVQVFAVGSQGVVLRWDGAQWQLEESGTRLTLEGVWVDDDGFAWAVGHNGAILQQAH